MSCKSRIFNLKKKPTKVSSCTGGPIDKTSAFVWFGIYLAEAPPCLSDAIIRTFRLSMWSIVLLTPSWAKSLSSSHVCNSWSDSAGKDYSGGLKKKILTHFLWFRAVTANRDHSGSSWKGESWKATPPICFPPENQGNSIFTSSSWDWSESGLISNTVMGKNRKNEYW